MRRVISLLFVVANATALIPLRFATSPHHILSNLDRMDETEC